MEQTQINLEAFLFSCFKPGTFYQSSKLTKGNIAFVSKIDDDSSVSVFFHPANEEHKILIEIQSESPDPTNGISKRSIYQMVIEANEVKNFIKYAYEFLEKEYNVQNIQDFSHQVFEEQKQIALNLLKGIPSENFSIFTSQDKHLKISYDVLNKKNGITSSLSSSGFAKGAHEALTFKYQTALPTIEKPNKFTTCNFTFYIPIIEVKDYPLIPQENFKFNSKNPQDVLTLLFENEKHNPAIFKSQLELSIEKKESSKIMKTKI